MEMVDPVRLIFPSDDARVAGLESRGAAAQSRARFRIVERNHTVRAYFPNRAADVLPPP